MTNNKENIQPELQDIIEMISRYVEANKRKVCFIASFVAFEDGICEGCEEETDELIKEDSTRILAYGDKQLLRNMLNDLRDEIEDAPEKDELEGFINL